MGECAQIISPKGLAVPTYEGLPSHKFRLRWRFDFASRPSKFGVWDSGTKRPEDSAAYVKKDGLVRACIEGEFKETQEEYLLVECQGQDFALFQWEAYAKTPAFSRWAEFTPRVVVAGLSLLTRDERITVYVNGQWCRRPLNEDEKQFSFNEHKA